MSQFYILIDDQRRDNAIEYLKALNLKTTYSVEVKQYRKNRSNSQNRLYWSWLGVIGKDTGYTPEELHEMFKARFLGIEEKKIWDQAVLIPKSTAKLTTVEFTDYLNRIEQVAQSMGLTLPHPDDYRYAMGIEGAAA